MELKRRFIFHGDAVAIGDRIVRPDDVTLDPSCASALTVVVEAKGPGGKRRT